jgi:hypothetical protein
VSVPTPLRFPRRTAHFKWNCALPPKGPLLGRTWLWDALLPATGWLGASRASFLTILQTMATSNGPRYSAPRRIWRGQHGPRGRYVLSLARTETPEKRK